eukprot:2462056-Alexandrium_andersonii.AAC.1
MAEMWWLPSVAHVRWPVETNTIPRNMDTPAFILGFTQFAISRSGWREGATFGTPPSTGPPPSLSGMVRHACAAAQSASE